MRQQSFDAVGETKYGLQDFVPTPGFCIDALVASKHRPPPDVLDPFAGDGAILRRLVDHGWDRKRLRAVEIRKTEAHGLNAQGFGRVVCDDWFAVRANGWKHWPRDIGIVTNVPWSILVKAVMSLLDGVDGCPRYVASLQPLEELGGVDRCGWLNKYPITALVSLKRRPFPKAARGCGWYIWEAGQAPMEIEII